MLIPHNISDWALFVIFMLVNTIFVYIIAVRTRILRNKISLLRIFPIALYLLAVTYISTGSLKSVIKTYYLLFRQISYSNQKDTNIYLLGKEEDLLHNNPYSKVLWEMLIDPQKFVFGIKEFTKMIDMIYVVEKNYLREIDEKFPLILFSYIFSPFVTMQLFLLTGKLELLLIIPLLQILVTLNLSKFIKKQHLNLEKLEKNFLS